jgi:hypothetical protein
MIDASTSTRTLSHHLSEGEEVYGPLGAISPAGLGNVLAMIGSRAVLLPDDLPLPEGQIFVLRLDDQFYVRRGDA